MADTDRSDDFLIGSLALALYWMDESLQRSLKSAGWPSLSRTRSMIMLNIAGGINRPAHIAKNIGVSRQAVHQMLQEMQTEGLVYLEQDPSDKRAKLVYYSEDSKDMRAAAEQMMRNIESELGKRIGHRSLSQLKKAMGSSWGAPVTVGSEKA